MQQLPPGPRQLVLVHLGRRDVRRRLGRRLLRQRRYDRRQQRDGWLGDDRRHRRRYYGRRPTHRATATSSATSGRALKDGTAKLVACATAKKPYATVEISNPNGREAEFQARVLFYDDRGTQILNNSSYTVEVPARGTATTRVPVGDRLRLKVDHCEAEPEADVSS